MILAWKKLSSLTILLTSLMVFLSNSDVYFWARLIFDLFAQTFTT